MRPLLMALMLALAACGGSTSAPPTPATLEVHNGSIADYQVDVSAPPPGSHAPINLGDAPPNSVRCFVLPATSGDLYVTYVPVWPNLFSITQSFHPAEAPGWRAGFGNLMGSLMDAPTPAPRCQP